MTAAELRLRCQRCGADMEMRDPAPGAPWRPDQFWVCPKCNRHFWTTYVSPPAAAGAKEPAKEAAKAPPEPAAS